MKRKLEQLIFLFFSFTNGKNKQSSNTNNFFVVVSLKKNCAIAYL